MNKDIVCQVPALVGPGKMPMQGSAGAWLPWALPAASAAVELSRQLGAPPPGGGVLGQLGPTAAGSGGGGGARTDVPGALRLWLPSPQAPAMCSFQPRAGLWKTVPFISSWVYLLSRPRRSSEGLWSAVRIGTAPRGTAPMLMQQGWA